MHSFIGHHWRVRELESDVHLLDVHAHVLVARSCLCTAHLKPRGHFSALATLDAPAPFGMDPSNGSSLVVELQDANSASVHHWNHTAERLVGYLHPLHFDAPNATHQLLVHGVRTGDVITVRCSPWDTILSSR